MDNRKYFERRLACGLVAAGNVFSEKQLMAKFQVWANTKKGLSHQESYAVWYAGYVQEWDKYARNTVLAHTYLADGEAKLTNCQVPDLTFQGYDIPDLDDEK